MKCHHLGGDYVGHPCKKKKSVLLGGYVKMFTIRNWKRNLCAWLQKAPWCTGDETFQLWVLGRSGAISEWGMGWLR